MSMAVTLFVMSQMFYELDAQQCIIRGEETIRGMMLKGHTFIEGKTGFWLNCLDKCDDDVRCQSFNYVISHDICELNNRTKEARPEDFVPDSYRFYIKRFRERVSLGSVPELPAESCAEIKASEGEDAVSGNYWFDSIKPGDIVLARCDMTKLDIDDCASHPCKNNGTCTDLINGFNCSCAKGFNGTQCETDNIDDCASHPCKNNGTCTDRVNGFNCSCALGFNGTQCETDIDDCAIHPCKNNGSCTDRVNGFNCSCAPGFNGTQCETDVDDCATHPCKNNGTCTDRVNGFNCSCAPGFNGTQCETDINECAAQVNPCGAVANSECKNTNGSYNCQCKDGFVRNGPKCEVDVCQAYKVLNTADRKDTYTGNILCDNELKKGWYRFEGDAGTRMPTTCVDRGKCGTSFPGWLNGMHPTVADGEVRREVCFSALPNCCKDSKYITVKNCSSYYVYKLDRTPSCDMRYCGTDSP